MENANIRPAANVSYMIQVMDMGSLLGTIFWTRGTVLSTLSGPSQRRILTVAYMKMILRMHSRTRLQEPLSLGLRFGKHFVRDMYSFRV